MPDTNPAVTSMLREERRGGIVILTMNQPSRRNALAMQMRAEIVDAMERLEGDTTVQAIILTGADGVFSAGGDLSGMNVTDFAGGRERFRLTNRLVKLFIESSKPIIAAVEGWAVGAGLGIALCCDTIIAAEDARFMAGFGKVGLVPDFAVLHTLPRRVGEGRARQIILYAEPMPAAEAERIGLIDRVVPPGTALQTAIERVAVFTAGAPLPAAMSKSFLARGLVDSLEWERNTQSALFLTADHAEGKAAFLGKRAPVFKGQ